MRVIAGSARGRRLVAPTGSATRPTSDRVREALFSILGPPEPDLQALDLFAGAGTLGIEALSRGASRAVFVDSSRAALRCLRRNLEALDMAGVSEVHLDDAPRFARRAAAAAAAGPGAPRFGWIFLDPPYAAGVADATLEALGGGPILAPGGIVVVEHDRRSPPRQEHGSLVKADSRRYGDTELTFFRSTLDGP